MAELILEIVEGPAAGLQIPLTDAVELGRDPSLPVGLEDDQVSRRHARVTVEGGQPVLTDLGSTNGTYLNGEPIAGPRTLQPEDRIRVGVTVLQLRTAQQVTRQASVVMPVPDVTAVSHGVLQPAAPGELALPGSAEPAPAVSANEPGFVPPEVVEDAEARSDFQAIARLVDPSVKHQTNIAVIALLGAAGLAVLVAFGLK